MTIRRPGPGVEETHQVIATAWLASLAATGLPFPDGRPRLAFAMPLPVGVGIDRDLVDLELAERQPVAVVRAAITETMPAGIGLVELHDVWPGEVPLAAQARRAEYAVTVRSSIGPRELAASAARLLASEHIPRSRGKGGRSVGYDLRPLVVDVALEDDGPPARLRIVVALDPQRGVGRPEEVVAALARDAAGDEHAIALEGVTRRRIVLEADPPS